MISGLISGVQRRIRGVGLTLTLALAAIGLGSLPALAQVGQFGTSWAINYGASGTGTTIGSVFISQDLTQAFGTTIDASGNVYQAGLFNPVSVTVGGVTLTRAGLTDCLIVKYSTTGSVLWAKSYGSSGASFACKKIALDGASPANIYALAELKFGNFASPALTKIGTQDAVVIKFDSTGTPLWAKNFGGAGATVTAGGLAVDGASPANVYATFHYDATLTTPAVTKIGSQDGLALKLDATGAVQWTRNFGGSGASVVTSGLAVDTASPANLYLVGNRNPPGSRALTTPSLAGVGTSDAFLFKIDGTGAFAWTKNIVGNASGQLTNPSIALDRASPANIYMTVFLRGSDLVAPIAVTNLGTQDLVVLKLDSTGTALWGKAFGGGTAKVFSAYVDVDRASPANVYVGGYYYNGNLTSLGFTKQGAEDMIALKLDGSGNTLLANDYGGPSTSDVNPTSVVVDNSVSPAAFYIGGNLLKSLTSPAMTAKGANDGFLVKLVPPVTTPGAPTSVTATAGNGQATVTFTAPASDGGSAITGYTVASSPATGTDTNAGSTGLSHVVTGLTNGVSYTFTVTATNANGTGPSSTASNAVTPVGPPPPPTTIVATPGVNQAVITFSAPTSNGGSAITGYTATANPGGLTATATASPITMTGLTNGQSYTFTVTATNAYGTGTASTASNAVTPANVPGAPTITAVSATGLTTTTGQASVTFSAPASDGGSAITGYTVTSNPAGGTDTCAGCTSLAHTVSGLTNGTSYTFTVTARNAIGTGAASAPSSAVVPKAPQTITFTLPSTSAMTGTSLTVSATSSSALGVVVTSATPTICSVTGFVVSLVGVGTCQLNADQAGDTTFGPATTVTKSINVTPGPPGPPTSVVASNAINGSASVAFAAPANNGGAAITRYTVTSNPGGITATGASSPITITGLNNGTAYTFTVTATNPYGAGSASVASNAVTPLGTPIAGNGSVSVPYNGVGTPVSLTVTGATATSVAITRQPANGTAAASGTSITYSPRLGFSGRDTFDYSASNAAGATTATITVNVALPVISVAATATDGQSLVIGESYAQQFSASGGLAPYRFQAQGALPPGLSLSADGALTGVPTAAGTYDVAVIAIDSGTGQCPCSGVVSQRIVLIAQPLAFAVGALPDGVVGAAYPTQTLRATRGQPPYSYSIGDGGLPPGLTLGGANGVIAGTPTADGRFDFVVQVVDSANPQAFVRSRSSITVGKAALSMRTPGSISFIANADVASAPFVALGGTAPYKYTLASGALPAGLTLSPSTGIISGRTTSLGTFPFSVRAVDASGGSGPFQVTSAQQTLTVSAMPVTATRAQGPGPILQGTYGAAQIVATGGIGGPYDFSIAAGRLPAGMALDAAGFISGTPGEGGVFPLTIVVSDRASPKTSASLSFPLIITRIGTAFATDGLPPGTAAVDYGTQTIQMRGGVAPFSFTLVGGALPPGLSLNSSGSISGVPTGVGSYTFTVQAIDAPSDQSGDQSPASKSFTVTISPPVIKVAAPQPAPLQVGTAMSTLAFSATGGTQPYAFSISAGTLPTGVQFSKQGVLSGTPRTSGTFPVTVSAYDSTVGSGAPFSASADIVLKVASSPLILYPGALADATTGVAYSDATIGNNAYGGSPPYQFVLAGNTAPPPGLVMDRSTGQVVGLPTVPGDYGFLVAIFDSTDFFCSNGQCLTAFAKSTAFTLKVKPGVLRVVSESISVAHLGVAYSQSVTASDGTAPYTFTVVEGSLPPGLTLNPIGLVLGTPTTVGSYTFTVQAADALATPLTGRRSMTISVTGNAPVRLAAGKISGTVGAAIQASTLQAVGGVAPYTYSIVSGALPPGLTLSAAGAFSGVPTADGTATVLIQAKDSQSPADGATATMAFVIAAPSLQVSARTPPATAGQPYSGQVSASGGTAPYKFAFAGGSIPAGLTIDAKTGALGGTLTQPGVYSFQVVAFDSSQGTGPFSGTALATINAGSTLRLLSPTLASGLIGTPYAGQSFTATGGAQPYIFSVATGAIPPGMALSAEGVLSGTPTATGTFNFSVAVTDAASPQGRQSAFVNLTVAQRATLALPSVPPSVATLNTPYIGASLAASGGVPPYAYTISGGALPPGMVLLPSGVLTGTPSAAGTYQFTLGVTDSASPPSSLRSEYSVTVATPLALNSDPLPSLVPQRAFVGQLSATGGVPPYSYSLIGNNLPGGLSFSPAGRISGTPASGTPATILVQVTDSAQPAAVATGSVALTVTPSVVLNAMPMPTAQVGRVFPAQTLQATGGSPPYTFVISSGALPNGLTLSSAGVISGNPTDPAKDFTFEVTVIDSSRSTLTAKNSFTIRFGVAQAFYAVQLDDLTTLGTRDVNTRYLNPPDRANPITDLYDPRLVGGALPPGMSFMVPPPYFLHCFARCYGISGSPTTDGKYSFTLDATVAISSGADYYYYRIPALIQYTVISKPKPLSLAALTMPDAQIYVPPKPILFPASAGTPPYVFTVTDGAVPPGMKVSSAGVLAGTPTAGGRFGFEVSVADSGGAIAKQRYTLAVNSPLALSADPPPDGKVDAVYPGFTPAVSGGIKPYTFTASTPLPDGLSLSAQGVMTGTPKTSGTYTLSITATDSSRPALSSAQTYILIIRPPDLVLASQAIPNGMVGVPFPGYGLKVTGGTPPYTFAVAAGALPAGLTLSLDGQVSGTPLVAGTRNFLVSVIDSQGAPQTVQTNLSIKVDPPTIEFGRLVDARGTIADDLPLAIGGTDFRAIFVAKGGLPPYTFSAVDLPAVGLSLSPNGALTGTAFFDLQATRFAGYRGYLDYPIKIAVRDSSDGASGGPASLTKTFTLRITPLSQTAPTAQDLSVTTAIGGATTTLLASGNGQPITGGQVVTPPKQGTATIALLNNGLWSLRYEASPTAAPGTDTLTYSLSNSWGTSNAATATINIRSSPAIKAVSSTQSFSDNPASLTVDRSVLGYGPFDFVGIAGADPTQPTTINGSAGATNDGGLYFITNEAVNLDAYKGVVSFCLGISTCNDYGSVTFSKKSDPSSSGNGYAPLSFFRDEGAAYYPYWCHLRANSQSVGAGQFARLVATCRYETSLVGISAEQGSSSEAKDYQYGWGPEDRPQKPVAYQYKAQCVDGTLTSFGTFATNGTVGTLGGGVAVWVPPLNFGSSDATCTLTVYVAGGPNYSMNGPGSYSDAAFARKLAIGQGVAQVAITVPPSNAAGTTKASALAATAQAAKLQRQATGTAADVPSLSSIPTLFAPVFTADGTLPRFTLRENQPFALSLFPVDVPENIDFQILQKPSTDYPFSLTFDTKKRSVTASRSSGSSSTTGTPTASAKALGTATARSAAVSSGKTPTIPRPAMSVITDDASPPGIYFPDGLTANGQVYSTLFTAADPTGFQDTMRVDFTVSYTPESGYWWAYGFGGRGFAIEIKSGRLNLAWLDFNAQGQAEWFTSTGPMTGNTAYSGYLDYYLNGSSLGQTFSPAKRYGRIAPVTIVFDSATTGTITINGADIKIQRYAFDGSDLSASASPRPSASMPETGFWFAPVEPGQGLFIEAQRTTITTSVLSYGDNGRPTWLSGTVQDASPTGFTTNLRTYQTVATGGDSTHALNNPATAKDQTLPLQVIFTSPTTGRMVEPGGRIVAIQRYPF